VFLTEQHRYSDALDAFTDGIAKNPGNSMNYYGFGQAAQLGKERVGQGIENLLKFLTLPHDWLPGTPTYKQAHYQLGRLYALSGDRAGEKAQYVAALDLDPTYEPARSALARM